MGRGRMRASAAATLALAALLLSGCDGSIPFPTALPTALPTPTIELPTALPTPTVWPS